MFAYRLLALLVAVLCIVARIGVEASGSQADEVKALAGPNVACRTSSGAEAQPEGPGVPDGLAAPPHAAGLAVCLAPRGSWRASRVVVPAHERRGDPKASRGPPSLVVS